MRASRQTLRMGDCARLAEGEKLERAKAANADVFNSACRWALPEVLPMIINLIKLTHIIFDTLIFRWSLKAKTSTLSKLLRRASLTTILAYRWPTGSLCARKRASSAIQRVSRPKRDPLGASTCLEIVLQVLSGTRSSLSLRRVCPKCQATSSFLGFFCKEGRQHSWPTSSYSLRWQRNNFSRAFHPMAYR